MLNLADDDVAVRLWNHSQSPQKNFTPMWQLLPENKPRPVGTGVGLNGTGVALNGRPLRLIANNTYPKPSWGAPGDLLPALTSFLAFARHAFDPHGVTLPPRSITFLNVAGKYRACNPTTLR